MAGIVLCSIKDSNYIEEKMEVSSYMIFGPVFFASIGLKTNIEKTPHHTSILKLRRLRLPPVPYPWHREASG